MNQEDMNYIEHEVKIRVLQEKNLDIYKAFERIDARFESIDRRFEHLENKISSQFICIIGTLITLFGGLMLTKFFGGQ
jgi:hypothetical protein